MRLAYLCTDPGIPYGGQKGASVHLGEMVAALAAHNSEMLVLVAAVSPGALAPRGVSVELLPGPGKAATAAERIGYEHELAAWLATRLRRFQPRTVYERLALHSAAGTRVARELGIAHLLEVNAPLLEEAAHYRVLEEAEAASHLEHAALAGSDLVLVVSPPLADYAASRGAQRVEVLQNAVAIERFPQAAGNGARPVAVFSGSLRPWHGLDTIAAAWRLLGAAAPPLMVIGDGPARELLDGLNAEATGAVAYSEVPDLLARADIGLAPYGASAPTYFSPLKVFEYLAAGLATVVADLPAVAEVLSADTAVLMPPGDAGALAAAVTALCADQAERARLGRNGRALVEASHTWMHRAARVLQVANDLAPAGARLT